MSGRDSDSIDLTNPDFRVHELEAKETEVIRGTFAGYVAGVIGKINDGKEATVYLCEASDTAIQDGIEPLLAAKVYRAEKFRNFANASNYRDFSRMRDKRMAKAMKKRSQRGQENFHRSWVTAEFNTLKDLHRAGVRVPVVYQQEDSSVLMSFVGNEQGPAPRLVNCKLTAIEAQTVLDDLLVQVERMVQAGYIHGDLSAYNILYWQGEAWLIDVPQAVQVQTAPDPYGLLQRDLINLEKYFRRYQLEIPISKLMHRLL